LRRHRRVAELKLERRTSELPPGRPIRCLSHGTQR
jgi:hypothetical protein